MKDASDIEKALELLSGGDAAKAGLLRELLAMWASDGLKVFDGDRQRALRPDILRRLLGLALTDDERAVMNRLPAGCRMRESAKVISPEKLKCGEHVWVGEGAVLDASGGLEIGSHTSVGLSVFVWSHSSHLTNLSMQNETASALIQRKPTKIGSGCFIAGPSVILPGVTIGDRVLIRPFSTVSEDVPDGSMVDSATVTEGVFTEAVIGRLIKQQLGERR